MADGLPDRVDCVRLAEDAAVLDRVYQLRDLPRLEGLLAEPRGTLEARFVFTRLEAGGAGAQVRIRGVPRLTCQRCLRAFDHAVQGASEVEFAESDDAVGAQSEREVTAMSNGQVSLRDLAEEEMLLALPLVPRCDAPSCGNLAADAPHGRRLRSGHEEVRRPFSGLADLLKKT